PQTRHVRRAILPLLPQPRGARLAGAPPVAVAGLALTAAGPRGRLPTVDARPQGRGAARGGGRPFAAMAAPVRSTHLAPSLGERAPSRVDPPTDATGARDHPSLPALLHPRYASTAAVSPT